MKIKAMVVALSVASAFAAAVPAHAQLGGLSALGGKSETKSEAKGDLDSQVKSFGEQSNKTYKLTYFSLMAMKAAYASTEEMAKIKEQVAAFKKTTDPKEQQAQVNEALKTNGAKLTELASSKDAEEQTKNLSAEKKKQLLAGVSSFTIAALGAGNLGKTGADIVKSVSSNPMNAGKVMPVKDALPVLSEAVSMSTNVIPALVKVMKGANLSVPSVQVDTKPADVESMFM